MNSPQVLANNRVMFRFGAPFAKAVSLEMEGAQPIAMTRDAEGVWSVTTAPLDPDFYGYAFNADGVRLVDLSSPLIKPNLLENQAELHVPGPSLQWEVADVPHGVIHHHFYRSDVLAGMEDFYVYTPPNYSPTERRPYPVLYLLHGFSDDASAWTAVGRANVILDNLIAQKKVTPMIVVMPLGYGAPEILSKGWAGIRDTTLRRRNLEKFGEIMRKEIIPQVETMYSIARNRESRAIAGLSMGGAESLVIGLNDLPDFAWVGSFSASRIDENFASDFPALDARANTQLRLIWIACGTSDDLISANRKFREWLGLKGIRHSDVETPGGHTWMVWRRNLIDFASLLFR